MRAPSLAVTFTKKQMEYLKDEASRLGISVSGLIRRIIDEYMDRST
jgi:hypothetical protein